jgi:hypothetical protein
MVCTRPGKHLFGGLELLSWYFKSPALTSYAITSLLLTLGLIYFASQLLSHFFVFGLIETILKLIQ